MLAIVCYIVILTCPFSIPVIVTVTLPKLENGVAVDFELPWTEKDMPLTQIQIAAPSEYMGFILAAQSAFNPHTSSSIHADAVYVPPHDTCRHLETCHLCDLEVCVKATTHHCQLLMLDV